MARPRNPVPAYKKHPRDPVARCWVNGQWVSLGAYNSSESLAEYQRVCAEVRSGAAAAAVAAARHRVAVSELIDAFGDHAEGHYRRPDGTPTGEVKEFVLACRHLHRLYGHTPAVEFGPRALQAVRQSMVDAGWCRTRVNKQVGRVRRVFRWAVSQELVPAAVVQALACVAGLQRGRTTAREIDPVRPVPQEVVAATLPHLWPTVRAMVELQRLTGMRPGEVRLLRLDEVDRADEVWVYRPSGHKMAHAGRRRPIYLGPLARGVLTAYLRGDYPPPAGVGDVDVTDTSARRVIADAYERAGRPRDATLLRARPGRWRSWRGA